MKMYSFMYLYFMLFSVLPVKIESYDNIQQYSEEKIVLHEDDSAATNSFVKSSCIYGNKRMYCGFYTQDSFPSINSNKLDVWISKNGKVRLLKSKNIVVFDYPFNIDFSSDGTKAICYNIYFPPYGYDDDDKYIDIFDIQDFDHIKKQTIEIEKCVDYKIVGDSSLFCTEYITEFGDGTENYSFAIYKSKLYDENNRIPVAIGADMRVISSDGRYILATRNLYGKTKFVIIDALTSKLAYLWEDQTNYKSIYYDEKRYQFAFDYGTYIKYLIMPDSFPHDALEYQITDKFENESFWNKIKERY